MAKKRRGMIVKNTNERAVEIQMSTRLLRVEPGEEQAITADEVRDPVLRENLQVRSVSIVRPATPEEEEALRDTLDEEGSEVGRDAGRDAE